MAALVSAVSPMSSGYRARMRGAQEGLLGGVAGQGEGGKGFLAAIRLKGVILPARAAIPATVAYLYGQGGGW